MSDRERFEQWMEENGYTLNSLAPLLGIRYNTLWYMVQRRWLNDALVIAFIKRFGCDVALHIFADRLNPQEPDTKIPQG